MNLFTEISIASEIGEKFTQYHKDHPTVWVKFEELANSLWNSGVRHYGSKGLFEVMRYHTTVDTRPNSKFKINNNYSPHYAKMYEAKYPDRKGFFETREREAA